MLNTYIVAEVGPNHNGSIEMAIEMVRRISKIGVNAVKFQLSNPDNLYSLDSFKADYQKKNDSSETAKEMSAKRQLSLDEHKILYNECRNNKVDYLCTAFDSESLIFLDRHLDLPYFKIASGEIFSIDMLGYMSNRDKPIILSTGMATFSEIETTINLLNRNGKKDIILLHCISNYPAPYRGVNLNVMNELKKRFQYPVGFSDHTIGNDCAIAAVALGACLIEKHVTVDKNLPGPDHKSSSTIGEFADLVKSIRNIEIAMGSSQKNISEQEKEIARAVRKSIVSIRVLEPGEIIKETDICFKRPGTGFLPIEKDMIIGKKLKVKVGKDRVITRNMIEWQ